MLFYKKTLISNSRLRFYSKWWWSRLSKVSNILVEILCKDSEKRALLLQNPFIFNEKQCRAPTSICHFSIHPSLSVRNYLRNHTSSDPNFWYHMGKMVISPGAFKRQKAAQNKKWKLHPSCATSQDRYSIWS